MLTQGGDDISLWEHVNKEHCKKKSRTWSPLSQDRPFGEEVLFPLRPEILSIEWCGRCSIVVVVA